MFHGGGGFQHSEVYNMPIWLRGFHIQEISKYNKDQNDKINKSKQDSKSSSQKVVGPNIKPTSTYNFKK